MTHERWNVELTVSGGKVRIHDTHWVERQQLNGRWLPVEPQAVGRGDGDG